MNYEMLRVRFRIGAKLQGGVEKCIPTTNYI